ncbi:Protein of unknown function [Bacillus wiedmannii]|uniref:Uncharacterized protein n=1 Tax=Bacillus wiedmannii TaxID=1890302 RepID=A0AB37YTF8_9BACI|nr:Protein of unknown function [Bacillus wiedmannii]
MKIFKPCENEYTNRVDLEHGETSPSK